MSQAKVKAISPGEGGDDRAPSPQRPHPPRGSRWQTPLIVKMLQRLGAPPLRVVLWTGESICISTRPPRWTVYIRDRLTMLRLLFNLDPCFGDAYASGRIEVEGDLVGFLETMYRRMKAPSSPLLQRHRNTPSGSQRNIHHHYDIGNAFYEKWLDADMLYTCAYYAEPGISLEAAQIAKMDHVCRKVRLQPGQTVVEAGCGWGGLARHMASRYGVKVRAFNISREQIAYARQRAAAEGLGNRVEFIADDYRQITGQYDVFMSVGMLEHVGANYYNELGRVIDRSLVQGGRGLIHTIGRHRPMVFSRWIESRIFPGADPPTLRQMMDIFEPHNMAVLDVENLRLHYARTLHHWLERYERAAEAIGQMFDEEFVRAWRLYLAGSQAAFTTGFLQLYQVTFARYNDNDLPATRAALYRE